MVLPKQDIEKYLDDFNVPELLTRDFIKSEAKDLNSFLSYCSKVTKFLEKNASFGNIYNIKGPCFEDLLREFIRQYDLLLRNPNKEACDGIVSLIKAEQAIYLVTNDFFVQDISIYLRLLDELYEDNGLEELIMLLYWKFIGWAKEFPESYKDYFCYLKPFLEILSKEHVDLLKLSKLEYGKTVLMEELKQKLISYLQNHNMELPLKEGKDNFSVEDLRELKRNLFDKFNGKGDDYYYGIGLISYNIHLINFLNGKNEVFISLCIMVLLYKDNIKEISTKIRVDSNSLWQLVEELCEDINSLGPS